MSSWFHQINWHIVGWIGVILLLILNGYRAYAQRYKLFPKGEQVKVRFQEEGVGGHNLSKGWNGCLEIVVTEEELWISGCTAYDMFLSGAEQGLLHRVPLTKIRSVQELKDGVEVEVPVANNTQISPKQGSK